MSWVLPRTPVHRHPSPFLARNGPTGPAWRCPLIGVDRKWLAEGQDDAIDPEQKSANQRFAC
jgi:hypothetical protein